MKQTTVDSRNKPLEAFEVLEVGLMTIEAAYSLNPDGTVTIKERNSPPRRINRESCQNAIETVTKNKEWYITEEAYNKSLSVFQGAAICFPKEGESDG